MNLSPSEQNILMNIQLGVICTDMVDFCRSGHICTHTNTNINIGSPYMFLLADTNITDNMPIYVRRYQYRYRYSYQCTSSTSTQSNTKSL